MSQNKNKSQEKIQKSNEEKLIFFSTNPYWEKRDKENKEKMQKLIKEENKKIMKEVKQYPHISEASQEIAEILRKNPNDKIEMAKLYKPKRHKINLYERTQHNLADYLTINRIMELKREKAIEKIKEIKNQNEEEDKIEEPPKPIPQISERKIYDNINFKETNDETRKNLCNLYNEKNNDLINNSKYPFYNKSEISYVNNYHQPLITDKRNDIMPAKIFGSYSNSSKEAVIKNNCLRNKNKSSKNKEFSKRINYNNKVLNNYHKNRVYDNDYEIRKQILDKKKKCLQKEKNIIGQFGNKNQILKFETNSNNKETNNMRLQDLQCFQSFINSFNSTCNTYNNDNENNDNNNEYNLKNIIYNPDNILQNNNNKNVQNENFQNINYNQNPNYNNNNENNYYNQFLNQCPNNY